MKIKWEWNENEFWRIKKLSFSSPPLPTNPLRMFVLPSLVFELRRWADWWTGLQFRNSGGRANAMGWWSLRPPSPSGLFCPLTNRQARSPTPSPSSSPRPIFLLSWFWSKPIPLGYLAGRWWWGLGRRGWGASRWCLLSPVHWSRRRSFSSTSFPSPFLSSFCLLRLPGNDWSKCSRYFLNYLPTPFLSFFKRSELVECCLGNDKFSAEWLQSRWKPGIPFDGKQSWLTIMYPQNKLLEWKSRHFVLRNLVNFSVN